MPCYRGQARDNIKANEQIASPTLPGRSGLLNMTRLLIFMWPKRQVGVIIQMNKN